MKIYTDQDVELVNCRGCSRQSCEEPRKVCQSISADACAFALIQVDGMPRTDFCLLYKTVTTSIVRSVHSTTTDSGVTAVYSNDETDRTAKKKKLVGGVCTEVIDSTSYDLVESQTQTTDGESSPSSDYTTHQYSSSGSDGICTGSSVYTDNLDPTNNDTIDFSICIDWSIVPDSSFTYSGAGVYTKSLPSGGGSDYDSYVETVTYSDPITASDLADQIAAKIAELDEGEDWPEAECSSAILSSKTYTIQDPPAPPAEVDPDFVPELVCSQVSGVIKGRYKIGIPASAHWDAITEEWKTWDAGDHSGDEPLKTTYDVAHAAWVTAHADWVADSANPDRGPEPIEPIKRTYFSCQWDEVFFPAKWEEWKSLRDAFDTATAAHAAWVAAGSHGTEPTIPAAPGPEPETRPSLVSERSWTYSGTDDFSDWFEIPIPETEGETRVVNMLTKCYRSSRLGVKPTSSGEVWIKNPSASDVARRMAESVDRRIAMKSPSTDKALFVGYNHSTAPTARNATVWCADVKGITAISSWNSQSGHLYGGVLIAPDMVIFNYHARHVDGTDFQWMELDGTIHTRALASQMRVGTTDINLAILDSDLPAGIEIAKVFPAEGFDNLSALINSGSAVPGIRMDQDKNATVGDCNYAGSVVGFTAPTDTQRSAFYEDIVTGDSGSPAGWIYDSQFIIATSWHYGVGGSGDSFHYHRAAINAAMTALGSAYQLSEITL